MISCVESLSMLAALFSPRSATCIGPVSAQSISLARDVGIESIFVLEPDVERIEQLERMHQSADDIRFRQATFFDAPETAEYFRASIAAASGFISLSHLEAVWANVKTLEKIQIPTDLETIQSSYDIPSDWVFLDRLDISKSIKNIKNLILSADVVISRHLTKSPTLPEELGSSAVLEQEILLDQGFIPLLETPDPMYRLKRTIWVKEWKKKYRDFSEALQLNDNSKEQADILAKKEQAYILAKQDVEDLRSQIRMSREENEALRQKLSDAHGVLELAKRIYTKEKSLP